MRKRWTEQEARVVLAAWAKSGLSLTQFAENQQLMVERLRRWRVKFESRSTPVVCAKESLALLPVRINSHASRPVGEPVAIFLRTGHVIKVGRGFDEEAFGRVVAVLEDA
jgi:hypothetical protein